VPPIPAYLKKAKESNEKTINRSLLFFASYNSSVGGADVFLEKSCRQHLMDIAQTEKEHATISFLKWFVNEQREEEQSFGHLLQQVKRFGGEALYT